MRSTTKFPLPDAAYPLQKPLSKIMPRHGVQETTAADTNQVPPATPSEPPQVMADHTSRSHNAGPHKRAEQATFKAFLNGYMREITSGDAIPIDDVPPTLLEFDLPRSFARLRVTVRYWSRTGPHDFGEVWLCNAKDRRWRPACIGEVIPMLVRDCFARSVTTDDHKMYELQRRILNSYDQITKCCDHVGTACAVPHGFLAAEQALAFGHWLHPTPKSREGMADWQAATYAPEFSGTFQLRFFAAHADITISGSAGPRTAQDLIRDIPGLDQAAFDLHPDEVLIPMHPMQAEALCLQPAVQELLRSGRLRDLGAAGTPFSATSSVRTVYAPDCPWMFKFSLPVKITNSQRVNLHHELEAGVIMARLFEKTGFLDKHPRFSVINDPAFVSITLPDQRESGFEVIIRENPFSGAAQQVVTIAALTADPPGAGKSMLADLIVETAKHHKMSEFDTAIRWFNAYLDCALHPALALYDGFGIALEAHQQNSLLDVHQGFPTRYYFRDNQGYYISEAEIDRLARLEPGLSGLQSICFPEDEIRDRFGYYLIVNQVFSIISRLGRDGFVAEDALLDQLRKALRSAAAIHQGPAGRFATHLLTSPEMASKANLLTRIHDVDELRAEGEKAIYVHLKNPIAHPASNPAEGTCHVFV